MAAKLSVGDVTDGWPSAAAVPETLAVFAVTLPDETLLLISICRVNSAIKIE